MQYNTIFFIAVKALHVTVGFPAHHQELKNCTYSIWYLLDLVTATPSVGEMEDVELWQQERILYYAASSWLYLAFINDARSYEH